MMDSASKYKVAVFIHHLGGGGMERAMLKVCESLVEKKIHTDLVLMNAQGEYLSEIPDGVNLKDLSCPRFWTSLPSFVRYLRNNRPDAILSAMPLANGIAVWASKISRIDCKLFLSERNAKSLVFGDATVGGDTTNSKKLSYYVLKLLIPPAYRYADGIIAVSEGVSKRLKALPFVNPEKVHVIYNPTWTPKIDELASQPLAHPWFADKMLPVILFVGRLAKQKNLLDLIKSFDLVRKLRPARLLLLGEGEDRAELERLVRSLGITDLVAMPGFDINPFPYMAHASVFVLSSTNEGFPNVLVEAMACGTPVVSTDCPSGPKEILDSGRFGRLVQIGDVNAMAVAIEEMLDNPTPPEILKKRAREFSQEKAARLYIQLLAGKDFSG
jgi:glycosyltransferase involved in cell wall biosynthesis